MAYSRVVYLTKKAKRVAAGQCVHCLASVEPGKKQCAKHLAIAKIRNRRYRQNPHIKELDRASRARLASRFCKAKHSAKVRELEFSLTKSDFALLIAKPCAYCGFSGQVGLDRVNNDLGYTSENVVPCCRVCNTVKMDNFSFDEMLRLGKVIQQIRKERNASAKDNIVSSS